MLPRISQTMSGNVYSTRTEQRRKHEKIRSYEPHNPIFLSYIIHLYFITAVILTLVHNLQTKFFIECY
jgi:hypothetical protein